MTIYLFFVRAEIRIVILEMHEFILKYYADWFPKLPSYVAFNTRRNKLVDAFSLLLNSLITEFAPTSTSNENSLVASMPIITGSGKSPIKVAKELTDKSFCSSKNLYYHGLKLHALGFQNIGHMPHPENIILTKASENDLNVYRQFWATINNRAFFGDKIYTNKEYLQAQYLEHKAEMLTPIKAQPENLKQFDAAFNEIYSKAVSSIR